MNIYYKMTLSDKKLWFLHQVIIEKKALELYFDRNLCKNTCLLEMEVFVSKLGFSKECSKAIAELTCSNFFWYDYY